MGRTSRLMPTALRTRGRRSRAIGLPRARLALGGRGLPGRVADMTGQGGRRGRPGVQAEEADEAQKTQAMATGASRWTSRQVIGPLALPTRRPGLRSAPAGQPLSRETGQVSAHGGSAQLRVP